jgi:hypothetical protein
MRACTGSYIRRRRSGEPRAASREVKQEGPIPDSRSVPSDDEPTFASYRELRGLLAGRLSEDNLKHEQAGSDDDCAISDVEGGPLVVADIEKQEVDDAAADDAIPKVSDGAAENQ